MKEKIAIIITVIVVIIMFLINVKMTVNSNEHKAAIKKISQERDALMAETQKPKTSSGEAGNEIYTIEIWDDGSAKIITMQGYVKQIEDKTLIVTDKTLKEVKNEL